LMRSRARAHSRSVRFSRRRLSALSLLAFGAAAACAKRPAPPPPNVVLVVVDTLRPDVLGCYGGRSGVSPHLDRLARSGVVFTAARAQAPWTVPSLSSLLTSCQPSEPGQAVSFRELVPACPNVAVTLTAAAYTTAAVADLETPLVRQGFASFDLPFGAFPQRAALGQADLARETFARASAWLEAHAGARFFLFVHTYEVHDYFLGKDYAREAVRRRFPDYEGRFLDWALRDPSRDVGQQLFVDLAAANEADMAVVRGLYAEGVRAADAGLGELLATLARLGLESETLVVVTSDHGEGFDGAAHRFGHGGRLHDDLLHVPLVMSWPGQLMPGVSTDPVELVDVVPSLLAVAQPAQPPVRPGRALLSRRPPWRRWLGQGEVWGAAPAPKRWEGWAEECCFAVDAGGLREARRAPQAALLSPPYTLIQAEHSTELYDLVADPGERRNLAAFEPDVRERLGDRLRRRLAAFNLPPEGSEAERRELLRSLGYVQ